MTMLMATNVFHKALICQSCKCAAITTLSKRNSSSLFMKVSSKMSQVKSAAGTFPCSRTID